MRIITVIVRMYDRQSGTRPHGVNSRTVPVESVDPTPSLTAQPVAQLRFRYLDGVLIVIQTYYRPIAQLHGVSSFFDFEVQWCTPTDIIVVDMSDKSTRIPRPARSDGPYTETMPQLSGASPEWFVHRWYRTYDIANQLEHMAARDLEMTARITDEGRRFELIENWPKVTLVHKFARIAADDMFYNETDGPYIRRVFLCPPPGIVRYKDYLSVTHALQHYGIGVQTFDVPHSDATSGPDGADLEFLSISDSVADTCHRYFTEELMWSEPYQRLLDILADEVFHTVFTNRTLLYALNWIAALIVSEMEPEDRAAELDIDMLFQKGSPGKLKRKNPPIWARRAIFHRDSGRCTYCKKDISGLYDSMTPANFDHMVPLDAGGLNDVTNLQLLCQGCNNEKSNRQVDPGEQYRRWFPRHPGRG
jgi:hypothetical protein